MTPKLLVAEDLSWLHYLFEKRYPGNYDRETTERWFLQLVVTNPMNMYAVRTEHAFLVAMQVILPWIPSEPEVNVVGICADDGAHWEIVKLLRASISWARKRNAAKWRISSDTDYDVSPLAMRVGAEALQPRFEIDLRKG